MPQHKPDHKQPSLFGKPTLPQMPEGYYSPGPNPNLRRFIEEHATPYDPATDDYNVPPFDKPITTTKATAIYNMHTYWSKKPHDAIREYIQHYTNPGDIVLDPFCGSGGTALAALLEGRAAIAIDLSPAATFITKNYCTPVDVDELQRAFEELERKVRPEMDWLYETRCDRCDGRATIAYTVYSQIFQCPRCMEKVPLFDCPEIQTQTAKGKPKTIRICPHCQKRGHKEEIRSQSQKFGYIPVLVNYLCDEGCKPRRAERRHNDANPKKRKYFEMYDIAKLQEIANKTIPHWYPQGYDMVGFNRYQRDALWLYNVREVADLFTKRNLWALSSLFQATTWFEQPIQDTFKFCLSSFLLNLSRLYKHRQTGGGQPTGNYYVPQVNREMEAWAAFQRKFSDIVAGLIELPAKLTSRDVIVSTQSAINLSEIRSNSIDYIFTDPPYAGKYQYGELNFVWEAWLSLDTTWHPGEIIVNETRGKSDEDWADLMRQAMAECFRVLKPGHWVSLCYHDTSEGTWSLVQDVMAEAGFVVDRSETALFIDTGQKTYNQTQAEKVTQRDLVINFRKPRLSEISGQLHLLEATDFATFQEAARAVLIEALTAHPGSTADRLYDELVSRLVRTGQFERHNFDELLRSIAEPVSEPRMKTLFEPEPPTLFGTHEVTRWYLKATADVVDEAETAKEAAAARKLESFMSAKMRSEPGQGEGVHYSDLFEQYLPIKDKPRRLLQEWLPEFFFKTLEGTWRPPAGEEERAQLATLRSTGLLRRVKRFGNALLEGVPPHARDIPESAATLADWIRQCRRAGLYEIGRALYEKGGIRLEGLDEIALMELEEDYQVCVRRSEVKPAPATRKRQPKLFSEDEFEES